MKNIKNIIAIFVFGIALSACQKEGKNGSITFKIKDNGAGNIEIINVQGGEGPYEYGYQKQGMFIGIDAPIKFKDEATLKLDAKTRYNFYVRDLNKSLSESKEYFPIRYPMGSFTDSRDNESYKTVSIGGQVWMAENLRYELNGKTSIYNHLEAKFVCPNGWHLPSKDEYQSMIDTVAQEYGIFNKWGHIINTVIVNNSYKVPGEWMDEYKYGNEENFPNGFLAYPTEENSYSQYAYFWATDSYVSHSLVNNLKGYTLSISSGNSDNIRLSTVDRNRDLPCRCLQD